MKNLLAHLFLALLPLSAWAAEFDCIIEARQNVEIRSPVEAVLIRCTMLSTSYRPKSDGRRLQMTYTQ